MENKYERIVVAIDGSDAAKKAFEKSIELAKSNGATLIITHVIDSRAYARLASYDRHIMNKVEEDAQELLAEYENAAKEADVPQTKIVLGHGSPKSYITKEIIPKVEADLIIAGATGLNAVERFMMGSVSERIVRDASCDVLIVK